MMIALHKNATTTPAIRAAIQSASGSDYELARQFKLSRDTIRKWRKRDTVLDGSHTAHRLQTTLNAGQEALVVYLRSALRLSLDDLLAVIREFIEPAMSRSALDRLLRRRGINRLPPSPAPSATAAQPFKAYEPGYVHVDVKYLPQMADEHERRYVFVAIDRATRWVFIVIKNHRTAAAARSFLNALAKAAPFKIRTLLSDNGTEFTDRLFGGRARSPSGEHEFDRAVPGAGHRAPAHQAQAPADQRHGRALQRALGAGAAHAPLQQRRGPADHATSLRLALQRAPAAEGTRAHHAASGAETMALEPPAVVQQSGAESCGT